jgi:hypothetical protein
MPELRSSAAATVADFRFVRTSLGSLYYAREIRSAPLNPSVALVLPPGAAAPGELSLPDSWAVAGAAYVFVGRRVTRSADFVAAVQGLLAARSWRGTRVLWIEDPRQPAGEWSPVGLGLMGSRAGGGTLSTLTTFLFRNYVLLVDGGLPLALGTDQPAFVVTPGAAGDIRLSADSGATELPLISGPLTIPLAGPRAGCLTFDAELPVATAAATAIDALDIGCRFFYDDPDPDLGGAGLLTSRRYAVFDTSARAASAGAASTIALAGALDPVAMFDPERTHLAFSASAPIRSFYRSSIGSPIDLAPVTARLQFAVRPAGLEPAEADPAYLVPHGCFRLQPPDVEWRPALLCGVGGAEYVALSAPTTLTFLAGNPAYAPDFDPRKTTSVARQGPRLTGPASTAWALLTADEPPPYFAQPEGAALFGHGRTAVADGAASGLLPFFELPAAALPTTGEPTAGAAFPLVPHAGAVDDLTAGERLEVQVLSQQRRQVIHGLQPAPVARPMSQHSPARTTLAGASVVPAASPDLPATPPTLTAVTPQGLVATFSADTSTWMRVQVAQSAPRPPDLPMRFALRDITDPLRAALLTNQQFLVVSDATVFQRYVGAENSLLLADYQFQLDPALWSRHGTIMLIKNCRKPLRELIADTNTWVLAQEFNRHPAATQRRLQQIVDDAATRSGAEFTPFRDLLTDPAWNGVLFLDVHVPLSGLPPELAGLAAGIDPAQFRAHHLGISQTPVPADLVPRDSSLFGLIDYENNRALSGSAYDFSVRSLRVRFANSVIASFTSRVALALNQLFAVPAHREAAPGRRQQVGDNGREDNVLELDGVFQRHGVGGSYVFSEAVPTTYQLDDEVLSTVEVTKAVFATVVQQQGSPESAAAPVQTTFTFWGNLAFERPAAGSGTGRRTPDLFSYDQLVYSGLELRMSFPRATPAAQTFVFDAGRVTFDAGSSRARPRAFAAHFPVTPKGMLVSGGTKSPADLGLLPVDTDLTGGPVAAPWFALTYDLNLGTVGALAGKAGLVVSFVVAWAPGRGQAVSVGLKLPASTGGKNQITVEGVLKITMFAVQLVFDGTAYLLKLTGIALSLFGKTLPPGASFDFFLFGDPDPAAGANSLGWYGAYKKDQPTSPV